MSLYTYPAPGTTVGTGFLDGVSDAQWSRFKSHCEVRRFNDGEAVVRAGQVDRALWMLSAGDLLIQVPGQERSQRVGSGTVLGEVAFFDGAPRSADVTAVGRTELLVLTYQNFERLADADPLLARFLLLDLGRFLAHRLRSSDARAMGS
jgi:CRP/FNR family cyclic AMP-dependent transcriptional regulator